MNSSNTYSPLYSSNENINIYKKNKKIEENFDTSTANISCDSRGRILIKENENENEKKRSEYKDKVFNSYTSKILKPQGYNTTTGIGIKKDLTILMNNCDKRNFIYDNISTKNYLNCSNINNVDCYNYSTVINNDNKKYENNIINNCVKELNNYNNKKYFDVRDLLNNNNLYNNSLNNFFERNINKNISDESNIGIHLNKNRNLSYNNNKCIFRNNNNPIFLNTYPPIYFYNNNNSNIKKLNNNITSINVAQNASHQKKNVQNYENLHILKYGTKNDKYFKKTISKIFNRKKDINRSVLHSLNSSEFLKELEKLKKNSSVNKNSVNSILQKKKINDNSSNTKSENNNAFNKIYNFIFPSSIKKSQNQNNLEKHVIKKENIESSLKNNQNYLINRLIENEKVLFDSKNNINNLKEYQQNYMPLKNQEKSTNNIHNFNEREDTRKLLFSNRNSFLRKINDKSPPNSKNLFLYDKHKYHERILTNIYQFTSGNTQKDSKIKNMNICKAINLKENNNANKKNYSRKDLYLYRNPKKESEELLEKEKIQNRIIEKVNSNINEKLKMDYACINENQNIRSTSNPQNTYKENNENQLKINRNINSNLINNILHKHNILNSSINTHDKGVNYSNSEKTCNYNDNNNAKQNISKYSTIKYNNFINDSEKISKNSSSIKNDNILQNKNNSNLALIHTNKHINNIFKNNNDKNVSDNKNMNYSFLEKGNIIIKGINIIHESEKENNVIKSKNLHANENTKVSFENKNNILNHSQLNEFFCEKNSELKKSNQKNTCIYENIKAEKLNYTFFNEDKLKNSNTNNYINKNIDVKSTENNIMKDDSKDMNDNNISKNILHISNKEMCNNYINENNEKFTLLNLLNDESKKTYKNSDDHFYVRSIVSITDKDNSIKEKNNSQKLSIKDNNKADFSKDVKNIIDLKNDSTNNTMFQKLNRNICEKEEKLTKNETLINDAFEKIHEIEDINNSRNVNQNFDELLLLKSKVYDDLNTCIQCINNLTKNKKLFEQLKKYKKKLDKKIKLEKVSRSRNSNTSESYYTVKNSYISSLLFNENKTNEVLNIKKDFKLVDDDNNIIINNKKDNNINEIHNNDNNKKRCNKKSVPSEKELDTYREFENNTRSSNFCDDKTISYMKTKIESMEDQKSNYKINLSDKYFLSEVEKPYIGRKKALLVTLNYNGLLEGCINDTLQLCGYLIEKFDFNELVLLNDCNISYKNFMAQKANKKNILNNLNNFIINSNNGDVLFFYFCGYSIKLVDTKFSENHNFALLPQDHSKNNYVYSNEIFNIIKKLEGGKQLCVIFDTTYTSYFVPTFTSITYNKNINVTEIYKNSHLESSKKYFNSLRTFGKIRDRNVDSVYIEDLKRPLDYELHNYKDDNKKIKKPLSPSIFFFSPDIKDRNSYELLINNEVRGLLTYCIGKSIELLKNEFSYHDLFVVASKLLIHIKNEYKLKYIKFKLSFSTDYLPDDIKFLSHEGLFLNKKKQLEEPMWKTSIKLYNLNKHIQNIYELKEKKSQENSIKKFLIIFIKDVKLLLKNNDTTVEYFVSSFLKSSSVNILYVRRNNTKCQKIIKDKIFFLEYLKLNLSELENTRIYIELFKKKKKNYFIARSVFSIRNVDGKYSLTDEKKNTIGIIDLTIKCVS
ncbi:metacaspase-like protein, putative [Plasmodium gallinaceum]|uniref:Metacaspase-like protein, putative n=1 Tax=Plasmodium gallinaceum TaxID=5849 RepID=A0A1J1GQ61_PLAGA|nr:metacaspase-like protein, putative [Plasmodium gallinaceum]CRG94579.1 metacaspase-like protein, putative [Plasmodium gallinaceum]